MRQLSLFSEQARAASPDDLAGLLCGPGQVHGFGRGTAARLTIVVGERWRACEIVRACTARGLPAERGRTQEEHHSVRTAFVSGLTAMAAAWTRGAVKAVPGGWQLHGAALRMWVLAAGAPDGRGYRLGLDPHAPVTHDVLTAALAEIGLGTTRVAERAGGPALRLSGRRRLARLAELVGEPPRDTPSGQWPS